MEEKKSFVKGLEESYNQDAKVVVMKEMMEKLIELFPVQGLKFINSSMGDANARLEKSIDTLLDDQDLNQESFRNLMMDLCFALTVYRQQNRMIGVIYNRLKDDKDEPIKIDEKTNESEEDDDDDRTK